MKTTNNYIDILENPPLEARGWTRWWWYAASVTKEGIAKELQHMKDANMGGVEIQVMYPLHEDSEEKDIKNHFFYSPEFFELLNFTIDTAEQLDMWVDFTLGSSWPFGGPFITNDMAPEVLIPYQQDITGPTKYSFDYTTMLAGKPTKVVMGKFDNGHLQADTLIDITDKLERKYLYNWPWGYELKELDIPEGNWKIFIFVVSKYKQPLGKPAPGMEGLAMDHCRADVSEFYFKQMGDPLIDKVGEGRLRTIFCDSIELGGNNWTSIMLDEFKQRRGYDLSKYMPALWADIGDITPEIRYDYYRTFSELTIENFFEKFTEWCNSRNTQSRIQAHGTWGDILKAYAAADIPEGETFGEHDNLNVNTIHRRLASSAGHLYNKNVISNETFTWLRMPRYLETLEMMKSSVDAVFLDGINHIVNHGYSYSSESEGKPGWAFYASSFISHNNTWWEYYKELSDYIHTVSSFLQIGNNYSEVGVYLPQSDIWSSMPMAELHMAMKIEEYIGKDLINSIQKKGYYFDYLNDEAICKLSEFVDDQLVINSNEFKVIILPKINRMPLETLKKLSQFVKNGGKLISIDSVPSSSSGLLEREKDQVEFQEITKDLFGQIDAWNNVDAGKTLVTKQESDWLSLLEKELTPSVKIVSLESSLNDPKDSIGYIERRNNNDQIFFLSNVENNEFDTKVTFKTNLSNVMVLDPLTKEIVYTKTFNGNEEREIAIQFKPFTSYLFIFSNSQATIETNLLLPLTEIKETDISTDWELEVAELSFKRKIDKVTSWEQFDELKYYSGQGRYEKEVTISLEENERVFLHFENVNEVAEVIINGEKSGVLWKNPREIEISDFVGNGTNRIEIIATNLWINHVINPEYSIELSEEAVSDNWPYFTAVTNENRSYRLDSWREKEIIKEPLTSGLSGKISLIYKK